MKIYTKTGDKGSTSLFGGTRVSKSDIRIDSYGTVDELNSHIGLLGDQNIEEQTHEILLKIQDRLLTIGSTLATEPQRAVLKSGKPRLNIPMISEADIEVLETEIDRMNQELPEMTHFVLPGGHQSVSFCHIARCVCRRAERRATTLYETEAFDIKVLQYLNRLSDFLFVLARKLSKDLQAKEIQWLPEKQS